MFFYSLNILHYCMWYDLEVVLLNILRLSTEGFLKYLKKVLLNVLLFIEYFTLLYVVWSWSGVTEHFKVIYWRFLKILEKGFTQCSFIHYQLKKYFTLLYVVSNQFLVLVHVPVNGKTILDFYLPTNDNLLCVL